MGFAPEYVRIILDENFEDFKKYFLSEMMAIEYAHLVMLVECGIVSRSDARKIRQSLDRIDLDAVRQVRYDGTCEDMFFYLEHVVMAECGDDAGGHLNAARSRNDVDMAMYRMRLRNELLALFDATLKLRSALLDVASRHRSTLFPAHTHTQPAQPTTVAHYLLAAIEELERDGTRFKAAYATTNRCPLGACAITGTGFPIDRDRVSELLGFDAPTGNTYGSIAAADWLIESTGSAVTALVGIGRLVQDFQLWATREVGYLRLPDGFVQISSIMPQKRNPVALEHARTLTSKAYAQMLAIPTVLHNTPFGDINDSEDDLQPLVATAFRDATRAVELLAAAIGVAEFDDVLMRRRAAESWVTVTELADYLAREHGLPFRTGHSVAAGVVRLSQTDPDRSPADLIAEASKEVTGREIRLSAEVAAEVLSPEHFIAVRRTWGGPAPEVAGAAIDESRRLLTEDRTELARLRGQLFAAQEKLKQASAAL